MPNVGPFELGIVIVIALLVFGPKRLPELGRSTGRGIREFKQSVSGDSGKTPELTAGSSGEPDREAGKVAAAADS